MGGRKYSCLPCQCRVPNIETALARPSSRRSVRISVLSAEASRAAAKAHHHFNRKSAKQVVIGGGSGRAAWPAHCTCIPDTKLQHRVGKEASLHLDTRQSRQRWRPDCGESCSGPRPWDSRSQAPRSCWPRTALTAVPSCTTIC